MKYEKISTFFSFFLILIFCAYSSSQRKTNIVKSNIIYTDTLGCGTQERDSVEFENLSYYDNNEYLGDILDSLGYPSEQNNNRNGTTMMNYANYPTRYWIPVKFWVIRRSNGSNGATDQQIRNLLQSLNNDFRTNNTLIQFYNKCDISYINSDDYLNLTDAEARSLSRDNEESGAVNVFWAKY